MNKTIIFGSTFAACALSLWLTGAAFCDESNLPKENSFYNTIYVDLNKDGQNEAVSLKAYNVGNDEYFGQLVVQNSEGKIIWAGPKPTDHNDPSVFGMFIYGCADMQVITDITKDGQVELIGSLPQSDVRPQVWRVWTWDGKQFVRQFEKCLVESPKMSGKFCWKEPPYEYDKDRWIAHFFYKNKTLKAAITDTHPNHKVTSEKAIIKPLENGFKFVKWE